MSNIGGHVPYLDKTKPAPTAASVAAAGATLQADHSRVFTIGGVKTYVKKESDGTTITSNTLPS